MLRWFRWPSFWLWPLMLGLSLLHPINWQAATDAYRLEATARGMRMLMLIAPICAAWAAWEAARLRKARWWHNAHARQPWAIVLNATSPIWCFGASCLLINSIVQLVLVDLAPIPAPLVLITGLATLAIHIVIGFSFGLLLPAISAVAGVLLLDYLWMVFPNSLSTPWIRHLTGYSIGCCATEYTLAPAFLQAQWLLVASVLLACWLGWQAFGSRWRIGLALLIGLSGIGLAAQRVQQLDYDPIADRDPSALTCSNTEIQLCVWPEHAQRLPDVQRLAQETKQGWQQANIAFPSAWSESPLQPQSSYFIVREQASDLDIVRNFAYAILPATPTCSQHQPYPAYAVQALSLWWLLRQAGVPEAVAQSQLSASDFQLLQQLEQQPREQQLAWFEYNRQALASCDLAPRFEA
ncbi:hypothetical protein [Herpetosiphon sp. NSE202]|uniref:DUF7224 domain-containing protein n=1 Tax=Herpetosiphon sp. NSE202 TaxID=3351349 RepID=UPI003636C5C5